MRGLRAHPILLIALAAQPALAADVAIAPATGAKKGGLDAVEKAVRVKMLQQGVRLLSESALEGAARKLKEKPSSPEAAKEAGADLLVTVHVKKAGKKFTATGKLYAAASGDVIATESETYAKGGGQKAGERIGQKLAEIASAYEPRAPAEDTPSKRVVAPKDDAPEPVSARQAAEPPAPRAVPKDESTSTSGGETSAGTTVERARPTRGGENKMLSLSVGLGSQVTSAYTVTVGSQVTGLAYTLSPLFLVNAQAALVIPGVGLGFEAGVSFVPVKYSIDVEPVVTPENPGGRFLGFNGAAFYQLTLARWSGDGRFFLAPLAGVGYTALSVEAQMPYVVVVSYSALAPAVGLRLGVGLGTLTLDAEARANIVVSYSESPKTTGADGGGIGLTFGARGRFWMSDNFALQLGLSYDFMQIGLKGDGDRPAFAEDPALKDATVFTGNLRTLLGGVLAI